MARRFLVLHGWENHRPASHWQHWLVERLRADGEQVLYPQLPSPDAPVLAEWLEVLRAELRMLGGGERVVIAHSLACLLWLHHAESALPAERVDRLLLVCPPSTAVLPLAIASFAPPAHLTPDRVAATVAGPADLVCTDCDPWCPEGAAEVFGHALDLRTHVVEGAGHLSPEEGYGPWPEVEAWAKGGGTVPWAAEGALATPGSGTVP